MVTGIGPTPSSKTIRVSAPVIAMAPMVARMCAVPTVGWPANCNSPPGVNIRTFAVWLGSVGREDECRLGVVELPCDLWHKVRGDFARVGKDRELISSEASIGENVGGEIAGVHVGKV